MNQKAELILDSIVDGIRVTCMRVTYPRIVHAEFMRHRCGSYCSASSRAIPLDRMIEQYCNFFPEKWRLHQSGMQPNEAHEFTEDELAEIEYHYKDARLFAIQKAKRLHELGVAKEQVNRLIEPFVSITHLVQMTEEGYESFFKLRLPQTAQYEIRQIAIEMDKLYRESTPVERKIHIPFYDKDYSSIGIQQALMASSARCARTSFYNHDGKEPTLEEDLTLANRLLADKHMSPFEFPVLSFGMTMALFGDEKSLTETTSNQEKGYVITSSKNLSGNLNNWKLVQFRKLLEL